MIVRRPRGDVREGDHAVTELGVGTRAGNMRLDAASAIVWRWAGSGRASNEGLIQD